MTVDFRKVESALTDFFRRAGIPPTCARGETFLGACTTRLTQDGKEGNHPFYKVVIEEKPAAAVVSLSDLARELARDL